MIRSSSFALKTIFNKNLLVPTGSQVLDLNALVELNNSGVYLWELLSTSRTFEELVDCMASHFEIENQRANEDVRAFLNSINQIGLIK